MTTPYNNSFNGTEPFSDTTAQFALSALTALTYTVPGASDVSYKCEFSWLYNSAVWVGYNVTATLPTANTMTTNHSIEFRPDFRYVRGGDVLSFIATDTQSDCGIKLLRVPG
jgi:hypothetical protein